MLAQVQDTPADAQAGDSIEHASIEPTARPSAADLRAVNLRKRAKRTAKAYPAIAAVVESWAILHEQSDKVYWDFEAAEVALSVAQEKGADGKTIERLTANLRRQDRRWVRAWSRADQAADQVLFVTPDSVDMIQSKAAAYYATLGIRADAYGMERAHGDVAKMYGRDLKALSCSPPPTPPTPQGPRSCPVAALAPAFERALAEEVAAEDAGDDIASRAAYDAKEALCLRIAGLQASSPEGAKLQILLAFDCATVSHQSTHDSKQADTYHEASASLLKSAMRAVGPPLPSLVWDYYIGGAQGAASDGARVVWNATRSSLTVKCAA